MKSIDQSCLPTEFAESMLEECGFIPDRRSEHQVKRNKLLKLLAQFQRMAISCDFDESMIAFHGYEIDGETTEALKVVYKSTKPWLKGLTVGAAIDAITGDKLGKSEFTEAVKIITEQLDDKKPANGDTPRMKGIIVKVSQEE